MDCSLPGSFVHGDSPGKNTGMGCHALLQGIFPTQGSNPGIPHCRWILYCLSHQGNWRILDLLQEIFLTQESNWGLLHCRWILHWLSYPGSPFYYLFHFKIKKKKKKKPQWLKPNKQTNTVLDKNDKLVKITERVLQTLSNYFSKPFVN